MAEPKTKPGDEDVVAFIDSIEDEKQREDSRRLVELMTEVTGAEPRLWAGSMVGFGHYHYRYASGHEGDSFLTGFAPRKGKFTLYMGCDVNAFEELGGLGKHKTGKGCLYLKRLDDVDEEKLRALVTRSVAEIRRMYPGE